MSNFDILLLIGLSGSGKSTWVKENCDDCKIISADDLRIYFTGDINNKTLDNFVYEEIIIKSIYYHRINKKTIIDTTNLQKERRRFFINYLTKIFPNIKIKYKLFPSTPETSLNRIQNALNNGEKRANVNMETLLRHEELYKKMLEDIKEENITEL